MISAIGYTPAVVPQEARLMKLAKLILLLAIGMALTAKDASAQAVIYSVTKIVDDRGPLNSFTPYPFINDAGTVAFTARYDAGGLGVFTGSGGSLTTIVNTADLPAGSGLGSVASINNANTVAFMVFRSSVGSEIYTGNGGPLTLIADVSGPLANLSQPAINSSGTVAFGAQLDDDTYRVYTGNGGALTTIAQSGGQLTSVGGFRPAINDSGQVAFMATHAVGGGIYRGDGTSLVTIADTSGSFKSVGRSPTINASGEVAFHADYDSGGGGVFVGDGGPLRTVAASFSGNGFSFPTINDVGKTLYFPDDWGGMLVDDGVTSHQVYINPIEWFDSELVGWNAYLGFNNLGEIAISYLLKDGTRGLAVARPTNEILPEPSVAVLSLIAAASLSIARPRRHRHSHALRRTEA